MRPDGRSTPALPSSWSTERSEHAISPWQPPGQAEKSLPSSSMRRTTYKHGERPLALQSWASWPSG
jgi:hypothetical protein